MSNAPDPLQQQLGPCICHQCGHRELMTNAVHWSRRHCPACGYRGSMVSEPDIDPVTGFPDRCECVPGEYDCGCSTEDGLAPAARAEPPCGRELDGGHGRCVLYYPHEGWCTPTMLDAAGDWTDEDRDNGCRPARQGTLSPAESHDDGCLCAKCRSESYGETHA